MADEEVVPDYSKFDADSVPPPEKPIEHTHKGRPDLDYDQTPVGPAEGVEYVKEGDNQGGDGK
ncbi:Protein C33A12.4 [Aphelenchoides avenae]|nr:Protein C33A12.4 [Aphelenchus avenae]